MVVEGGRKTDRPGSAYRPFDSIKNDCPIRRGLHVRPFIGHGLFSLSSSSSSSKRNRSKIEGSEDGPPRSVVVSLGKGYQWIGFSRFGKALEEGEA